MRRGCRGADAIAAWNGISRSRFSIVWRGLHLPARDSILPCTSLRHERSFSDATAPKKTKSQRRTIERRNSKDFVISVLDSAATKRDAKAYLKTFQQPVTLFRQHGEKDAKQVDPESSKSQSISPTLHLALVKIKCPQDIDDHTLQRLGTVVARLARLGLISVVVVDCEPHQDNYTQATPSAERDLSPWRRLNEQQARRVGNAINASTDLGARVLDTLMGVRAAPHQAGRARTGRPEEIFVQYKELLSSPLQRGIIPIVTPFAYTSDTQQFRAVRADEAILAITQDLAGLAFTNDESASYEIKQERKTSLDRLLIIDDIGAIPSRQRANGSHIFINLEQEYREVCDELQTDARHDASRSSVEGHLANLTFAKDVLKFLPPTTSALITTPHDAGTVGEGEVLIDSPSNHALGVKTRRVKNPLIHNLLTDRPAFSSSLPSSRYGVADNPTGTTVHRSPQAPTFIKRGMPITILPDPRSEPWSASHMSSLKFKDARLDLNRLVHLIEDSFRRSLDVQHYIQRVEGQLAGIIVAGKYEGGAILTWEFPTSATSQAEKQARAVPYLDKFAVLQRAQGSGGVADIVFTAMVSQCFPRGVAWRSRSDNPVNKWYFERALGTWRLPDSNWTMFWTTPDLFDDRQRWKDYVDICGKVEPSWADTKKPAD